MYRKVKTQKAVLLMEVALVVLITAVISVFLFRGYKLFINAQKKNSQYLQLALKSEQELWWLKGGIAGHKTIGTTDPEFKGIKKVVLKTSLSADPTSQGDCFDVVYFMSMGNQ